MSINRIRTLLIAVLVSLLGSGRSAWAAPPMPYSPWGTAEINGRPAPDGTQVIALIGDVQYGSTTTTGGGWYSIDVPGDDPDTPQKDGGLSGETVVFKVDGRTAAPTGTWISGAAPRLNLTVTVSTPTVTPTSSPTRPILYLPLILQ